MIGGFSSRSSPAPRIVVAVETSPGSGVFEADARLRAERVDLRSDDAISEATVFARMGDDFDFLEARQRYHGDLRMIIRTDEPDPAGRIILFDGYPLRQASLRDGGPAGAGDEYAITLTQVYSRWTRDERAQIFGRRMRSGAILDGLAGDPEQFASQSVHVEALPCVFNLDGAANRSAEPVLVTDRSGAIRRIHLFTHESDPSARHWSLLDALRYLIWFHHTPDGPVSIDEFLDCTEAAAGIDPTDRRGYVAPSALVAALLAPADDLNCEATNLVEAVALIVERGGVHATCETISDSGAATSRLNVWSPLDSAQRELRLAWGGRHVDGRPRYDTSALSARDCTTDNQLRRVVLDWDHRNIVTAPKVVGGVRRWEMTVDLVPGWLPEANLDNVDVADREDAKSLALTPDIIEFLGDLVEEIDWYRDYHRSGDRFEAHKDVGRLWVLNEDGAFDATLYNRNAPFDDYQPFDFAAAAGTSVTAPGRWSRRPRAMQKTITPAEDGSSLGVHVEVSYDAGGTWHAAVGAVAILDGRAGARFDLANPTAMIPPGGDWYVTNLWYAIIDQAFRVRATAVFDADERLIATHHPNPALTPTLRREARLLYRPNDYAFVSADTAANVLTAGATDAMSAEIDDGRMARQAAEQIAAAEQGGIVSVQAHVPWLEVSVAVGDRVTGIRGRDVSIDGLARAAAQGKWRWNVVGKTHVLSGRLETTLELSGAAVPVEVS